MTNSNFVACSTGKSAGLAALQDLVDEAARRQFSIRYGPYDISPPAST